MALTKQNRTLLAVTVNKKKYPYYGRAVIYKDLGGITGVQEAVDSDALEPELPLDYFLRSGQVRYLQVSVADGTKYRVLCVGDNIQTSIGNLKQKSIGSQRINTASIRQSRGLK